MCKVGLIWRLTLCPVLEHMFVCSLVNFCLDMRFIPQQNIQISSKLTEMRKCEGAVIKRVIGLRKYFHHNVIKKAPTII